MLQTRRTVARLALRPYRYTTYRTYADTKPSDPTNPTSDKPAAHDAHSNSTSSNHAATAAHHASTEESIGRGFYITIATLALSFALYKFTAPSSSNPDKQPLFTRLIQKYSEAQEDLIERNARHTQFIEQAGHDRNLFFGTAPPRSVELKFPEVFNTGAPWNVPAGHTANLEHLRAHYERLNREADEGRMERLRAVREGAKGVGEGGA